MVETWCADTSGGEDHDVEFRGEQNILEPACGIGHFMVISGSVDHVACAQVIRRAAEEILGKPVAVRETGSGPHTVAPGSSAADQRMLRARSCDPGYTEAVMSTAAKEIIEAALKLEPVERELIVEELTASLHSGFASPEIEAAWVDEIQRRSAEIDSGTAVLRNWPEVRDEILAELRDRRR